MGEPGTPEAARLRVVRRLWATRQEAAGPSERWFLVYAAALLIGIYVLPTVYLAGASLDPAAAAVLTGAEALPAASAALGLLAVMSVLLGGVQDPVFLTPLLGHLLLGGDFGRRRVFLLAGSACAGLQLGILWLVGQRWAPAPGLPSSAPRGLRPAVLLALTAGAVLPLLIPGAAWLSPGGWFALLWTSSASAGALLLSASTAVIGLVLVLMRPGVLEGMPAGTVMGQSRRLADARLYSSAGSFGDVPELFCRRPEHRGRRQMRHAVRVPPAGARGLLGGLRTDMAGALRTPRRLTAGLSSMTLGVLLVSLCFRRVQTSETQQDLLMILVPVMLLGTVLLHLGAGVMADGWRSLKDEFDAAPLFGWSPRYALLRRLPWPCAAGALTLGFGVLVACALAWWAESGAAPPHVVPYSSVLHSSVLLGTVLCAQFMQSMRDRQMPLDTLAPMPTPFGDLSGLRVLLWLADGLAVSVAVALGMFLLPWSGPAVLAAAAVGWSRTGQRWRTGAPRDTACGGTGYAV